MPSDGVEDPGLEEDQELPGEKAEREAEIKRKQKAEQDKLQRWLRQACIDGNLTDVEKILQIDARAVNYKSASGTTALQEACHYGHDDIVEYLVNKADADVNALDVWGSNALHFAAGQGHVGITMFLVEKGCDMRQTRDDQKLPIHLAKEKGHEECLEYLYHEMLAKKNAQEQAKGAGMRQAMMVIYLIIIFVFIYCCVNGHIDVRKHFTEHFKAPPEQKAVGGV